MLKLICPHCRQERVLTREEWQRIESELAGQMPAARKILECSCGLGQWVLALNHRPARGVASCA